MRTSALLLCVVLSGCAGLSPGVCPAGLTRAKTAELFFGRNIGAAEGISDEDWQGFVDSEIAPRFPDGFTVSDAAGAWRGQDGATLRERTKLLFVVLSGSPGEPEKLAAIRAAYMARFRQDSVMLFESGGCVSF